MHFGIRVAIVMALAVVAPNSFGQTPQDKLEKDKTAFLSKDDPEMNAAMRKARSTLPEFLALAAAPRPSTSKFHVKIGIAEEKNVEYF